MANPAPAELLEATLQANFAVICERWPEVAQALSEATTAPFEAVAGGAAAPGAGSVRVSGLQLCSAYDPAAEAILQARRVPETESKVTAYGLGQGWLVRELLRRPSLKALRVVLLSPSVEKVGLAFSNQTSSLQDPRIELLLAQGERQAEQPFAALPPAVQLADEQCLPLRDALVTELQREFVERQVANRQQVLAEHIASNEQRVAQDADVAQLFGQAESGRVLVVGPGPTLSNQFANIQRMRAGSLIVAISTALPPLAAAGIVPDVVVMIDLYSVHSVGPADGDKFAKVPLVYSPEVQGVTLDAWPGPRFAAYFNRPRYAQLRSRLPRANLYTSGTVAHSAVDLAVQLGAREVMLFGLDFAYPGGSSHAAGNLDRTVQQAADQGRTLIDGHGQRIASDPNLIAYLRDLEDYIAIHPEVTFLRADRSAAHVRGTQWLTD